MARQAKKAQPKSLEQRLWDAADALPGNQEPSEYNHAVLGLVFHAGDRHHRLEPEGVGAGSRAHQGPRLLAKYEYRPDLKEKAIELVLEQAVVFATGAADECAN